VVELEKKRALAGQQAQAERQQQDLLVLRAALMEREKNRLVRQREIIKDILELGVN
jgi:hypothetical protein